MPESGCGILSVRWTDPRNQDSFAGLRAWDLGFGVWGFEFKAYIIVLGFAAAEPLA